MLVYMMGMCHLQLLFYGTALITVVLPAKFAVNDLQYYMDKSLHRFWPCRAHGITPSKVGIMQLWVGCPWQCLSWMVGFMTLMQQSRP